MLIIFGFLILFLTLASGVGIGPGVATFNILSWLAFLFAVQRRRFSHLGLLERGKARGHPRPAFSHRDLRGYDIEAWQTDVAIAPGQFTRWWRRFPFLALPLMLGGVTGAQFGGALLVICNTLFLSLAIGLFVSSISREVIKAMTLTLILSLVFLAGLPWLDLALAHWDQSKFECVTRASPVRHIFFSQQQYLRPHDFRSQLALQHAPSPGFFGVTASRLRAPRVEGKIQQLQRMASKVCHLVELRRKTCAHRVAQKTIRPQSAALARRTGSFVAPLDLSRRAFDAVGRGSDLG